jgi:hypothetical protein
MYEASEYCTWPVDYWPSVFLSFEDNNVHTLEVTVILEKHFRLTEKTLFLVKDRISHLTDFCKRLW